MAFLSKIVVAATAFAALTAARPLAIRDVTSVVTETDYTTVDVPVTVWVDENGTPLSTVAQGGVFAASATPAAEQPKVEISASPSATPSVSAPVVPTTTPAPPAPVVPTTTPAPPAPVVPTTTVAPSVQAQAQAPAYTPPAVSSPEPVVASSSASPTPVASSPPASSPAAVAAPTNSASSGQSGTTYTGDITHWDGGLGACGWNVNTNSDFQIAMPVGMMGSQSNGNPYCGKSLTIKNPTTGTTIQATVGDKCMGCTGASIDLTNAAFAAVGNNCDGRCSGFEWWFN